LCARVAPSPGSLSSLYSLFFFQADDGIRARNVTGVQTCALPISFRLAPSSSVRLSPLPISKSSCNSTFPYTVPVLPSKTIPLLRSEERRVGKECRARSSPGQYKKNGSRRRGRSGTRRRKRGGETG